MRAHFVPARGAALVLVLWLVVGMSLLVLAGAQSARQHTQTAALQSDRQRLQPLLDAAIALGAQQIVANPSKANGYRVWQLQFSGEQVLLEQVPGDGLIDINVASPELLQALFERVGGLSAGEATLLIAVVRDFLSPPSGESSAGQSGDATVPARGGISDVLELRDIPGITHALYETIAPFLGYNGGPRINANSAPPALIDALSGQPGLGDAIHETPPAMRSEPMLSGVDEGLFEIQSRADSRTLRLRALVQAPDGRQWQRQVWLSLGGTNTLMPWKTRTVEPVRRVSS